MNNQRLCRLRSQVILLAVYYLLITTLTGCDAFTKKFTRKRKKSEPKEEIVLVPEDYSLSNIPVEERYRHYFLLWKSWQNELIDAFGSVGSHKRRKWCIEQTIENLKNIRPFLFQEKQKDLDVYLKNLVELKDDITRDIYSKQLTRHKAKAESLKRNILNEFSYHKVEHHLRLGEKEPN